MGEIGGACEYGHFRVELTQRHDSLVRGAHLVGGDDHGACLVDIEGAQDLRPTYVAEENREAPVARLDHLSRIHIERQSQSL